ncbi:MAG TPA: N-acetylmuramoyl-L-alanine amidase [Marmoricola sp.]|nr:N-acetylmuramoyl-L-alanine amidase [Marmoricola sp.]
MPETRPTARALRTGDRGPGVAEVRDRLARVGLLPEPQVGDASDLYDADVERAVRAFQQQRGLTADGLVGPATYRTLDEATWTLGDRVLVHLPGSLQSGDDVIALQRRLLDLGFKVGRVDGLFGSATEAAVKEFQRNVGIPPDGTCGPATLKALARLAPMVKGGSPNALRAEERIRRAGPQLAGKVVVLDPSPCLVDDAGLRELADAVTADLVRRVEGRLVATGVQAYLTTPEASLDLEEATRAQFANRADAHLLVSLQVDGSTNPGMSGLASYFYGLEHHGVRSSVGERFAGLVQREVVARTDLTDLRSHARSWDLLRMTRMPAVRVDVGYVTNPGDAARLADPAFRDVVAEGIVVAVQRLYLAPEADPHTGVLRVDEIRALRHASP